MIFYFSGTGNSKWVAEEMGKSIGEDVADIGQLMKQGVNKILVNKNEKVGLVFPIYAWGAPKIVMEFISCIKLREDNYIFAVCTCGDEAGDIIRILRRKIKINLGYSIIMPNNFILGFDVDSSQVEKTKIVNAQIRVNEICQYVEKRENIVDCYGGSLLLLKSYILRPLFNLFSKHMKKFHVEDHCDGCSICKENCPMDAIKIIDDKPVWEDKCNLCCSCINRCPKRAIQCGKGTKTKGRYYFKNS